MIKKHRNPGQLRDLINGALECDNVTELSYYLSLSSGDIESLKTQLLLSSIVKFKENSAKFLIPISTYKYTHIIEIFRKLKLEKIKEAFVLMENIGIDLDLYVGYKVYLIRRIMEPYKLLDNPNRINVLYNLLSDGFFTKEDIYPVLDEYERKHSGKKRVEGIFKGIKRELIISNILNL